MITREDLVSLGFESFADGATFRYGRIVVKYVCQVQGSTYKSPIVYMNGIDQNISDSESLSELVIQAYKKVKTNYP